MDENITFESDAKTIALQEKRIAELEQENERLKSSLQTWRNMHAPDKALNDGFKQGMEWAAEIVDMCANDWKRWSLEEAAQAIRAEIEK